MTSACCQWLKQLMVWLTVKHLPKVTLTEVKHSLQWNHKTSGGNAQEKKWAGDVNAARDWLWLDVDERMSVAEWLIEGCTSTQANGGVVSCAFGMWVLIWIHEEWGWRCSYRRRDKARAFFQKVKCGNNSITAERRTNKQMMSNQICMNKLGG